MSHVSVLRSGGPLRVAMVAPPYFAVPPRRYGGVEAVVADLVDALVERGHRVTLVGAGSPGTRAQQYLATFEKPQMARLGEPLPEVVHAARVAELLGDCADVDLVHEHTLAGPLLARGRRVPTLVTVHGPVRGSEGDYYRALAGTVRLVAISAAQRAAAPHLAWLATVHNGIQVETYPFRRDKGDYVLFLGRFHPQKAPHLAIDAARAAGVRIVLAGKCSEPIERAYFDREIRPRLGTDVDLVGVADSTTKRVLLSLARCLVNPVSWEEPFGLVMVEAMACGTPVVALRRASVPEIVDDGRTGISVAPGGDQVAGLAAAIVAAGRLDSTACRERVVRDFGAASMGARYDAAYRDLLAEAVLERSLPALPGEARNGRSRRAGVP